MRFVTYQSAEGLSNRLRTHLVAHAYALRCGAPLIVDWPIVKACGAAYSDLFRPSNGIIDASRSPSARLALRLFAKKKIRYNCRQPQSIVDVTCLARPKLGLVEFGEAFGPYGYETEGRFLGEYKRTVLSALRPVPFIEDAVRRLESSMCGPYVGIHIRRGDFHISYPHSLLPLDFYDAFISAVRLRIPSVSFYVSHDDENFVAPLLKRYQLSSSLRQSRQSKSDPLDIFGCPNFCNRDTLFGVMEALTDLCMLSKSKVVLGAPKSSFSVLAAFLGSKPIVTPANGSEREANRCADAIFKSFYSGSPLDPGAFWF